MKEKNKDTPIDARAEDVLEQIKDRYYQNKSAIIELSEISPLISNKSFIDFIIEREVQFTSLNDKGIADSFSETLRYISNKRSWKGNKLFGQRVNKMADRFALQMKPVFDELEERGFNTLQEKVDKLNEDQIKTARGKKWHIATVRRIQKRIFELNAKDREISFNVPELK
ncbi:hypothetical protein [uncultured Croceitalea sp.]|uniref:hypothetical protein n=1 Tax=uncultured Croceitalea sp. TaxID=1798908 RepID=UPI00374EC3C1